MATRKKKTDVETTNETTTIAPIERPGIIVAYKGFNLNMTCQDFQYELGKSYRHDGTIKHCKSGFHACEHPLNIFAYYAPSTSKFCSVKMWGEISRDKYDNIHNDTKIASSNIMIEAELTISELIKKTIDWVTSQCSASSHSISSSNIGDYCTSSTTGRFSVSTAAGNNSASSTTGRFSVSTAEGHCSVSNASNDYCISSASGDYSVSGASGEKSASSSFGDESISSASNHYSISSSTGDYCASASTGFQSVSSVKGDYCASTSTGHESASISSGNASVAINIGRLGKAKASIGGAIVLCIHDANDNLLHIRASKVGENGIKPDVFYTLDSNGDFQECKS